MNRFTILLGGDLVVTPRVLAQAAGTRVVAADSGIRHARELLVAPEIWVGDFDSSSVLHERAYPGVTREDFPAEKDKTDGELAVAVALREGARSLLMVGAFGGMRTDHAFLHVALGMRLAEAGAEIILTSGTQEGRPLLIGRNGFDFADGTQFSIIALSELGGLSIAGAKWPLHEADVPFGSSLTLSNEISGRLEITLRSGRAMLIAHPFPVDGA